MTVRELRFKRGTSTEWTTKNPVLDYGEPGYDGTALKIGDGSSRWSTLRAVVEPAEIVSDPDAQALLFSSFASYKNLARNPDLLIKGTVTRDANGAATSAPVEWPNGQPGTYTATTLSAAFPGAVDAYTITYGSPVTKTFTQPLITRDASGAATNVPAITVA